jgi:hypothetical protein
MFAPTLRLEGILLGFRPSNQPLSSPSILLSPSSEKPLDAVQYALVVVRPFQRRPDLAQLSRIANSALWGRREQYLQFGPK